MKPRKVPDEEYEQLLTEAKDRFAQGHSYGAILRYIMLEYDVSYQTSINYLEPIHVDMRLCYPDSFKKGPNTRLDQQRCIEYVENRLKENVYILEAQRDASLKYRVHYRTVEKLLTDAKDLWREIYPHCFDPRTEPIKDEQIFIEVKKVLKEAKKAQRHPPMLLAEALEVVAKRLHRSAATLTVRVKPYRRRIYNQFPTAKRTEPTEDVVMAYFENALAQEGVTWKQAHEETRDFYNIRSDRLNRYIGFSEVKLRNKYPDHTTEEMREYVEKLLATQAVSYTNVLRSASSKFKINKLNIKKRMAPYKDDFMVKYPNVFARRIRTKICNNDLNKILDEGIDMLHNGSTYEDILKKYAIKHNTTVHAVDVCLGAARKTKLQRLYERLKDNEG